MNKTTSVHIVRELGASCSSCRGWTQAFLIVRQRPAFDLRDDQGHNTPDVVETLRDAFKVHQEGIQEDRESGLNVSRYCASSFLH